MPPKRRRRFQGLYYHSSPPKVLPMNGQIANNNARQRRDHDDFSVKLSTIRIWMHEKHIGKLTRVLWAGQGNRLRQQASTNGKVKRFLAAVPYVMNSIRDVHQAVMDNSLESLQSNLEPPVPPSLVTCRDANGLNLIHKAAGLGHATILEYLITTWPDGVHETDITGKTPLHWAASAKNNMRCYTLLMQAGCDEEAVDYKLKTPSFYRHKPHEIERAFLTYVPEAPRVSPDVATDWEALSDDSGNGKKPDIKIPEMNGFGRHSNAESNENNSEIEMIEAVSTHEDEDVTQVDIDEPNAAKEDDIKVESEDIDEQPDESESENTKEDRQEQEEEHTENEEPQDEKQQTHTDTTANLIKDSDDGDEMENNINERNDHETENIDGSNTGIHTKEVEGEEIAQKNEENSEPEIDSSDIKPSVEDEQESGIDSKDEEIIEKESHKNAKETLEENTTNGKNNEILAATTSVKENDDKDILEDENTTSVEKEAGELPKPEPESQETLEENSNNEKVQIILHETTSVKENEENPKDITENENTTSVKEETDEKIIPDSEIQTLQEENQENKEKNENDEKEDESDTKTIGEALVEIKEEVKDNVKYLAKQIKSAFSDKEDSDKKDEISNTEKDDSQIEHRKENHENEKEGDKIESKAEMNNKDHEDGYELDNNGETTVSREPNEKENENQEKTLKSDANKKETKTESEEIKQENEISQIPTSAGSSNNDRDYNKSNEHKESESLTNVSSPTTSNQSSRSSNENILSEVKTPETLTAQKTTPKESPKKENDKTEEDENNNMSELTNGLKTTNTASENDITPKPNTTDEVTDEQFQELDKSLEEYKNSEESVLEGKEKDIGDKLEEMADNLKENVKEIADKVMNVFATTSIAKDDIAYSLENKSNNAARHTESPLKVRSDIKVVKDNESSDDTNDEDEVQFGTL